MVTIMDKNMKVINQNPKHSIIGFEEFAAKYLDHNPKFVRKALKYIKKIESSLNKNNLNTKKLDSLKSYRDIFTCNINEFAIKKSEETNEI